ncbi:hypothetical protein TELCIR_02479 [Teladorsagia circumcincta]|uniref:Uncharacterized protein n=1 Tax=Teladorsagia circumcincta TaxID=45464 RepID=A0A2G9UZ39_TELCI|nr:hypothetical protein TELCIR_02479 [Teladorsagia circumcincta]
MIYTTEDVPAAQERTEVESNSSENATKKRKKRTVKADLPQEPPEKKTKSWSRRKVPSPVEQLSSSTGESPKAVRRSRNRRPKTLNGLKEHASENVGNDSLLTRALLKGEALETCSSSSASPQRSNEVIEGLKRTRQIAVELSPSNVVV